MKDLIEAAALTMKLEAAVQKGEIDVTNGSDSFADVQRSLEGATAGGLRALAAGFIESTLEAAAVHDAFMSGAWKEKAANPIVLIASEGATARGATGSPTYDAYTAITRALDEGKLTADELAAGAASLTAIVAGLSHAISNPEAMDQILRIAQAIHDGPPPSLELNEAVVESAKTGRVWALQASLEGGCRVLRDGHEVGRGDLQFPGTAVLEGRWEVYRPC